MLLSFSNLWMLFLSTIATLLTRNRITTVATSPMLNKTLSLSSNSSEVSKRFSSNSNRKEKFSYSLQTHTTSSVKLPSQPFSENNGSRSFISNSTSPENLHSSMSLSKQISSSLTNRIPETRFPPNV